MALLRVELMAGEMVVNMAASMDEMKVAMMAE